MDSRNIIRIAIGVLVIVLLISVIAAIVIGLMNGGMMYPYMGFYPWMWIIPFLFFLLLLSFLFRLIFWGSYRRRYGRMYGPWYQEEDARDILEKRYARGEITREQYHQMLDDLQRRPPT